MPQQAKSWVQLLRAHSHYTAALFHRALSTSLTFTFTFSRRFYPKRLTYVQLRMYTHFTLMAHCTSGAIRGSVSCSRTLRQGIELATFWLLNDFSTSCTTVAHSSQVRKETEQLEGTDRHHTHTRT